jgi:hypothetical protein
MEYGKHFRKGVAQMVDLPFSYVKYDDENLLVVEFSPTDELTPAIMGSFFLEDGIVDPSTGVILVDTGISWLNSFLTVEFSKIANFVAIGDRNKETAVIVFSVDDFYQVGDIIEI